MINSPGKPLARREILSMRADTGKKHHRRQAGFYYNLSGVIKCRY